MTGRERGGEPVGLYLHIPFCRSKCPFCDFCSFPRPDAAMVEAYVDELIRRIRLSGAAEAAAAGGVQALDTVYIGGGTPTLLTPSQAARLMEAVHAAFFVLPDAEVTVEGNPAALTAEGLAAFRAGGVNRLSLGVQSANADELRALGRLHSFPDAVRAVETARAVGIGNISLDFMIGIPGQTPDSLRRTLEAALALEPEHLSAYCLSLEPGTPFGRRGRAGLGLPADEDEAAEQASALYELSARLLSAAGYEHYEISNYARPGMRSRHNLHTWQDKPYIGLGVGAYSYLHGVRFGQSRDLSAFLDGRDITVDRYIPDRREQMEEYIMLGLRLAEGISEADFRTRFGVDFWATRGAVCEPLLRAGLARRPDGRFALTESGWLVSNAILADLVYTVIRSRRFRTVPVCRRGSCAVCQGTKLPV